VHCVRPVALTTTEGGRRQASDRSCGCGGFFDGVQRAARQSHTPTTATPPPHHHHTTATATHLIPGGEGWRALRCGPHDVALLTGMRSCGGTPSADRSSLDVHKHITERHPPISKVYTKLGGWGTTPALTDIATWNADSPCLPPSPMELAMLQPMQLRSCRIESKPEGPTLPRVNFEPSTVPTPSSVYIQGAAIH